MVIQLALAAAFQEQPSEVMTCRFPTPPPAEKVRCSGEIEYRHELPEEPPACETVKLWLPTVTVPVLEEPLAFADT